MCMRALNHSYASERDLSLSFSFSLSLLLSFSLSAVVRRSTRELETQLATAVRGRAALDREHTLSVVGNLGPRIGVRRLEHRSEEFIQTGHQRKVREQSHGKATEEERTAVQG